MLLQDVCTGSTHAEQTSVSIAAPQIFITLGMAQTASLLGIVIVTAINIGATLLAIHLVDR